ncbi:MAG: T9SS type A sorting domain-containing protein [Crocinitomicaceae bacterium]
MKKLVLLFAVSLCFNGLSQQFWSLMKDPNVPISETYAAYMDYVGERDPYQVPGSKQFFRWYEDAVKIAYPHDNLSNFSVATYDALLAKKSQTGISAQAKSGGNWQSYGPSNAPTNGHNGKVDAMAFHPIDSNIIFIGGAFGLWRTGDGGATWMPFTDDYPLTGVTAVEIAQSNPSIVYFMSSGYYGFGSASLGVFKSTDGGFTWSLTNFNYQNTGSLFGRTLLVDPNNEDIVYVSTSEGIFKSTDGLNSYTMVSATPANELAFNPQNTNKIYACSNDFQYSEDGGNTWQTASGLAYSSFYPSLTMAVTEADSSVVYIATTSNSGGFGGLFKSVDGGANFALQSDTPNIFGPSFSGSGGYGGQGGYCIGIACSPTNANKLFCGGINLWTSDDGGLTWYSDANIAGTHADVQTLKYYNGNFWMGNDGGIFKTNNDGATWTYYQNMQTSLIYRIAVSEQEPTDLLTGWQDNGSAYSSGSSWTRVTGGDGMYCLFDYTDNDHRFTSLQYGRIYETIDGVNYDLIVSSSGSGVNSQGHFRTKFIQNRINKEAYFVGKNRLYESLDGALTWNALSPIPYSNNWTKVSTFDVCQKNDNYIYVESVSEAFRSEDHGQSWINISNGIDPDSSYISEIMVSPHDSLHIWLVKSGTNQYSKVYESVDGGDNWTNISSGLPNIPMNFIEYQKGSQNRVYVSTIAGIYYRDDLQTSWEVFGTGLPNCRAEEMAIDYENGTVYATTYGRGIWTNDIILDSIAPSTDFRAFPQETCGSGTGEVIYLDLSMGTPTNWEWSFPGGSPATSNMPSPFVTYPVTGSYTAQLVTTNAWGTDTLVMDVYVESVGLPTTMPPNTVEGFEASQSLPGYFTIENPDFSTTWEVDTTIGSFDASNHSIRIENYANGNSGNHDAFIMDAYNLVGATFCSLTFDVANKAYDASNVDTLAVSVSSDCGINWTQVAMFTGNQLAVGAVFDSTYFVPQQGEWNTYSINMNNYIGAERLSLKFENRSGGGNNMYLDNINLIANNNEPAIAAYSAFPTSICEGETVHFLDESSNFPNTWEWSYSGGSPASSVAYEETVTYVNSGLFDVELITSNVNGADTVIDLGAIEVYANPMSPTVNVVGNNLSTATGYSYQWYWDGFPVVNSDTNMLEVSQAGYYQVTITDLNGCSAVSDSVFLTISGLGENETDKIRVYPNPARNELHVFIDDNVQIGYELTLINLLGQNLFKEQIVHGGEDITLNVEGLPEGLYFLILRDESEQMKQSFKVVIDRE